MISNCRRKQMADCGLLSKEVTTKMAARATPVVAFIAVCQALGSGGFFESY